MKNILDKLVEKSYIFDYGIDGKEIEIVYGLISVFNTTRIIDTEGKSLSKALQDSGNSVGEDIYNSLVDKNDFYGYENKEELERRIEEETNFLNNIAEIVEKMEKEIQKDGKL